MKHKTRHLHILITAALLLAPTVASAQEYIKDLALSDTYSLIRTVDDDTYLLYSYYNSYNTFYLFPDAGSPATFMMTIDKKIRVNDMEIKAGMVYFCGERYEEDGVTRALFGHFPLENFPNVELYYKVDTSMTTFKKLDLYYAYQENMQQLHAVMTAVDSVGYGTMVDACHMGGYTWDFHSFEGKTVDETFDDVVVINDWEQPYVVFSSRDVDANGYNRHTHSRVWVFDIPSYINTPLFANFVSCYDVTESLASAPMLLERLSGWFASAARVNVDTLLVNRYTHSGYDRSVVIKAYPSMTVKDIEYNHLNAFCLDVLVTKTTATTVDSYIYPVQEFYFDENDLMYARYYEDEDLNSLSVVSYGDYINVASGHDAPEHRLRVYKYQFDEWVCSQKELLYPINKEYDNRFWLEDIYYKTKQHELQNHESTDGTKSIITICPINQ